MKKQKSRLEGGQQIEKIQLKNNSINLGNEEANYLSDKIKKDIVRRYDPYCVVTVEYVDLESLPADIRRYFTSCGIDQSPEKDG